MWVAKTDANGNPILDSKGQPMLIELPDGIESKLTGKSRVKLVTADEADGQRRRHTERVEGDLRTAQQQRDDLQVKLDEADKKRKAEVAAALPVEQQVLQRVADVERQLETERQLARQTKSESDRSIRRVGLVAYRERALRDVDNSVHHLVHGETEEEIDASADYARDAYTEMVESIRSQIGQQIPSPNSYIDQRGQQQYAQPPQHQPPMAIHNPNYPPPSPHYVQQPQYMQGAPPPGYPVATNPLPVPEQPEAQVDVAAMTTEQAVRSGRYGGEMRQQVLGALKGMKYPGGSLGHTPLRGAPQEAPPGYVNQPMGVQQPVGLPMPPMQPPQYQMPAQPTYQQPVQYIQQPGQQPQYAPQYAPPPQPLPPQYQPQYAPQPQQNFVQQAPNPLPQQRPNGARAAAQAAVSRTLNGGNPLVDPGGQTALANSHAYAARNGTSPDQAFSQRFHATPPIQTDGTN